MTARPISAERYRKPASAAVALALLLAMVVAAGCIGCMLSPTGCIEPGYVADRDITIVKVTPDGSLSWYKVIDTGGDDSADDIIATNDSGFVLSARLSDPNRQFGRYPYLIKLSKDGNFVWNRSIYEFNCESAALVKNQNGEIITVSGNLLCRFDPNGELISNITLNAVNSGDAITITNSGEIIIAGIAEEIRPITKEEFIAGGRSEGFWEQLCGNISPSANPYCGGTRVEIYAVATKVDSNDHVVWSRSLKQYGFTQSPVSIIELKDNQGYLVKVINQSLQWNSVRLDINGNFINLTPELYVDREGNKVLQHPINNTSPVITQTEGGGFISAGFPGSTQFLEAFLYHRGTAGNLRIVKISPEGYQEWYKPVPGVTANRVKKIIQTSDGGYAILCENDKFSSTK